MPRGVVRYGFFSFGGYHGYGLGYDPGGKARAAKEEGHAEEEQVKVTEKRKHNYSFVMLRGNKRTKSSIIKPRIKREVMEKRNM